MFRIEKLHNGVTVIFCLKPGFRSMICGVFIRSGSRIENRRVKGIAHFLEHMVFKGSKNYTHKGIKQEIEGRGGYLNGYTSQETTCYYAEGLKKNMKVNMDVLLDMVMYPKLDEEEIEKERNVILEEIKMYRDLPFSRASSLLDNILWSNHPLGEDVIGYEDTVKKITRQDLLKFKERYYTPDNIIIGLSGDIELKDVIPLIEQKIESRQKFKKVILKPPSPIKRYNIKIEKRELDQVRVCIGFRAFPYNSKERFPLEVLNTIMGANMSSRLFEEIREKRALVYDISTELRQYNDSGAFIISLGLDKRNVFLSLKYIFSELNKIKNQLVSKKELMRAKDYIIGRIARNLEYVSGSMFSAVNSYNYLGKIYTLEELEDEFSGVDRDDVRRVSQKIFDFNRVCISMVGTLEQDLETKLQDLIIERR